MKSAIPDTVTLEDTDPDIRGMLLPDEQVIFIASQSKVAPGGSLSPNIIYITNMRVLFKDPRWLGLKADILDVSYRDISTVMLKRGIFTTELYFRPHPTNYKIKLPALEKRAAQRISQLIQRRMRGELPSQSHLVVPEVQVSVPAPQPAEEKKPAPPAVVLASCCYCNYDMQAVVQVLLRMRQRRTDRDKQLEGLPRLRRDHFGRRCLLQRVPPKVPRQLSAVEEGSRNLK